MPHQCLRATWPFHHLSVSHSPQQYARQECVHLEAQIAAESTEFEVQVGWSTVLLGWCSTDFILMKEKPEQVSLWKERREISAGDDAMVRTSLTGNLVATSAIMFGLH